MRAGLLEAVFMRMRGGSALAGAADLTGAGSEEAGAAAGVALAGALDLAAGEGPEEEGVLEAGEGDLTNAGLEAVWLRVGGGPVLVGCCDVVVVAVAVGMVGGGLLGGGEAVEEGEGEATIGVVLSKSLNPWPGGMEGIF